MALVRTFIVVSFHCRMLLISSMLKIIIIIRDNFIILQSMIASFGLYMFPVLRKLLPVWDTKGFIAIMILHMIVSEPLYYWAHKCFHGDYLFSKYHSFHHSSPVPQPFTGNITHLSSLIFYLTSHPQATGQMRIYISFGYILLLLN